MRPRFSCVARVLLALAILPASVAAQATTPDKIGEARAAAIRKDSLTASRIARDKLTRTIIRLDTARRAWSGDSLQTLPVLFSFNGGISLGAYQAGVNWAMLEFIRQTRDSVFRGTHNVPTIRIAAMTGASAGNINVLLGAIQDCAVRRGKPSDSMLWKMWVQTGWNQFAPRRRKMSPHESGVLDRSSVKSVVLDTIRARMATDTFRPECNVPIGVVATRLVPDVIPYNGSVRVVNQRFAALFRMTSVDARLRFMAPGNDLVRDRALGAQLVFPASRDGYLASTSVFDVVEASAAYPVAFAPKVITYRDPECALLEPDRACAQDRNELFMDGGVFDNNPASLAVGIARTVDSSTRRPTVLFVDPSALRGDYDANQRKRIAARAELRADGINALTHFAVGFVPAARQYEMQSFVRAAWIGRDAEYTPFVESTTRAHPIVGEYFNAFGAFFGRPFREYDFYNGVADGVHFAVREIVCADARMHRPAVNDTSERAQCISEGVPRLAAYLLHEDAVGHHLVSIVRAREAPGSITVAGAKSRRAAALEADARRTQALEAVERATFAQAGIESRPRCPSGDLATTVVCHDGFLDFLNSVAGDPNFRDAVRHWHRDPACRKDDVALEMANCLAEDILVDLVRDSRGATQGLIDMMLRRLRDAEENAEEQGKPSWKTLVKTGEFYYRSTNQVARVGSDWSSSSIPPGRDGHWSKLRWLPYYAGGLIGNAGTQVGWMPSFHWTPSAMVGQLPLDVSWYPRGYVSTGDKRWALAATPSIGRELSWLWLNSVVVGPRLEVQSPFDPSRVSVLPIMPEVSVIGAVGKLRATLYRVPPSAASGAARLRGTISLADINGLMYFLFR